MARALFRILVGWILLTSLLAVSFAAVAEEGEPVGIVRAIIEREEGPPCECTGVVFDDAIADRIGDRFGFRAEMTMEGRCVCGEPDDGDPDLLRWFCFAGVLGEGEMRGGYGGVNHHGRVCGLFEGTYDEPAGPETPFSQAYAEGGGRGGPKNQGQTKWGVIYWTEPTKNEVEEALRCSLWLREMFGRIVWYDLLRDLLYHKPSPEELPEVDIQEIVQEMGSVWINIEPYGLIPASPNGSLRYQIYFDTDLDPATGVPIREDLGAEFTLWIGYNPPFAPGPQWAAALFRANDAGGFDLVTLLPNEDWDIGASRIRVRIPLSEMGNVVVLHWLVMAATGVAADWVPNEGVGFWLDTGAL